MTCPIAGLMSSSQKIAGFLQTRATRRRNSRVLRSVTESSQKRETGRSIVSSMASPRSGMGQSLIGRPCPMPGLGSLAPGDFFNALSCGFESFFRLDFLERTKRADHEKSHILRAKEFFKLMSRDRIFWRGRDGPWFLRLASCLEVEFPRASIRVFDKCLVRIRSQTASSEFVFDMRVFKIDNAVFRVELSRSISDCLKCSSALIVDPNVGLDCKTFADGTFPDLFL